MDREALRAAYREFQERGGLVDLGDRLKLVVTGNDRVRYINGQVTANIAAAKQGSITPACVTTAKGKLCADVYVGVWPENIVIDADAVLAETLLPRLERYIVADDVAIEDVSATYGFVHAIGIDAQTLSNVVGEPVVPVSRFGLPGFDLRPRVRSDFETIADRLKENIAFLDPELVEIIRIEQGVPRWGRELDENTLPPEAGLDRSHIDFHKGCYIGQEVISRIRSVGHVNRELVGFTAESPLPERAEIFSESEPERACGTLTSAGWSFALERPIGLGYLRRSAATGPLYARPAEAGLPPVPITVCALPFTK